MKTYIPYSLLAALAACGMASGASTAYTTPVGYVSLGDTAGANAVAANTDSMISVPLARPAEYAGTVASVGANTLTVSGTPSWTTNQFTSVPYCLVVKSGAQKGLFAVITANTVDTLTLTVTTGVLSGVVAADQVVIAKCWTLGSFLPIAGIPTGTTLLAYNGTTPGINLAANLIYTKGPSNWIQTFGGSGDATNHILYPGESFILRTGANPVPSLVISGEVPTWNSRTSINKLTATGTGQDNRISYFSPVGEALSLSSIPASTGDALLIFNNVAIGKNKAASAIITKGPTSWVGTFGLSGNQDAYQLIGGVGYVYRRAASAPAGSLDWNDAQGYQSGL